MVAALVEEAEKLVKEGFEAASPPPTSAPPARPRRTGWRFWTPGSGRQPQRGPRGADQPTPRRWQQLIAPDLALSDAVRQCGGRVLDATRRQTPREVLPGAFPDRARPLG